MKKIIFFGFLIQPILLVCMLFYAYMPIAFGVNIKMYVDGYDPRDLLRGEYVALRYDFDDIKANYEPGSKIYAILEEKDGIFHTKSISDKEPKSGIYIKGIKTNYSKEFGINTYFAPKEMAKNIEKELLSSKTIGIANLFVYNADARIVDIKLIKDDSHKENNKTIGMHTK